MTKQSMLERFWSRVRPEIGDACWMWTANKFGHGYGSFVIGNKRRQAHRVSWEIAYGPIPDGMCVCHRCDVPACVRPDHLFLGTYADNNADRDAKGRTSTKHQAALRLLTIEQAREIRRRHAAGEIQKRLAREFGVNHGIVRAIIRGWTYREEPINAD
jgi:hypothetical protein